MGDRSPLTWVLVAIPPAAAVVLLGAWYASSAGPEPAPEVPTEAVLAPVQDEPLEPLAPDTFALDVPIQRGATIGALLGDNGLPAKAILDAAGPHYDLTRIRPDRTLTVHWTDGYADPTGVSYGIDEDTTLVVERDGEGWAARLDEVAYDVAVGTRQFTLTRSLWQDGLDAGLRPGDLVRLAKIFEYEIDFNTELAAGAQVGLVADVESADGKADRLGAIHAVRLENKGTEYVAVRYVAEDGDERYYLPDGSSMRRPFLRSPLEFSRVTSGFNPKRFHPIKKTVRPHNGTDFGAPAGTLVRAVADGRVTVAGWSGGHGRFVKLDHEGPYETSYSHLSAIKVTKGQKVRQGDIIGKVGSTGLATGPHLHYQMWVHGKYVDAMKVDLPHQDPLPASDREAFKALVDEWWPKIPGAFE